MYKIGLFLLALSISLIVKSSFFQEPLLAQDSGAKHLTTEISDLDNRDSGVSGKATIYGENISLETTVSSNFLNTPFFKSENISLEATASSNFLKIPLAPEDSDRTKVEISISIKNNSRIPQRFTMFNTLGIEIVAAGGKQYFFGEMSFFTIPPKESECPLIQPGESLVHKLNLSSFRHSVSDEFILASSNKYGEIWSIKNLGLGEYKIRFTYQNNQRESSVCTSFSEATGFNPLTGVARLKDFWTGFAASNFVNLTLGF